MLATQQRLLFELSKSTLIDCGYFALAAEEIARAACKGLGGAISSIWLLNAEKDRLNCAAMIVNGVAEEAEHVYFSKHHVPQYFAYLLEQQHIIADDVNAHPATQGFKELYTGPLDIRSMINVPICVNGMLVGGVGCDHIGSARHWSTDDVGYMSALAEIAARALAAEAKMHAQEQVILAHASLEAQVVERTRSLKAALEQLQQAQKQLIQSEKMAALGGLVAGVAHEINTPLGISVTAASHLRDAATVANTRYQAGELDQDAFEEFLNDTTETSIIILRNLERAAQLVTSFKRVAVNQSDERITKFNLHDSLQDLVRSLSPECKKNNVICNLSGDAKIVVESYPSALDQVVTNLVMNALRHAFADRPSGTIDIKVSAEGEFAQIAVHDDGEGIAPDIESRIFEPFVTSKRDNGGTGLGLHISYNLVTQKLHGILAAESVPRQGATFTIRIPLQVVDFLVGDEIENSD